MNRSTTSLATQGLSSPQSETEDFFVRLYGSTVGKVWIGNGHGPHWADDGKYKHSSWTDKSYSWPADKDYMVQMVHAVAMVQDIYCVPRLFEAGKRSPETPGTGRYAWADCDEWGPDQDDQWDLLSSVAPRSFRVDSGRGRHVYIDLGVEMPATELEVWNRRIAKAFAADAKWASNSYLRVAGTRSHKMVVPRPVRILDYPEYHGTHLGVLDYVLPAGPRPRTTPVRNDESGSPSAVLDLGGIPDHVQWEWGAPIGADRSAQLARFVALARGARLDDDVVFQLARTFGPALDKYGDRVDSEVERLMSKGRR